MNEFEINEAKGRNMLKAVIDAQEIQPYSQYDTEYMEHIDYVTNYLVGNSIYSKAFEVKVRNKRYDEMQMEVMKWNEMKRIKEVDNFDTIYYVNFILQPDSTDVYDAYFWSDKTIAKYSKNVIVKQCPWHTVGDDNDKINKKVFNLPIIDADKTAVVIYKNGR